MKAKALNTIGAAMLTGSIALFLTTSCGGHADRQGQMGAQQAPAIKVMTVTEGDSESDNSFPATIKGKTDIDIRPQVTGFITKVHVDEGQQVRKGQVLFTLDQVQFRAAVEQAQAAVASAQTQVSTAQITADSKRKLFEKNIISEYELRTAENALMQAKAALSQAQAGLVTARKNLAYTVVTAPSNGVVGSIPNREGSLASPSSAQPLTTVSDNSQVYAYFSLTEKQMLEMTNNGTRTLAEAIKEMPEVELKLADGTLYPEKGKVATVSGVIDAATGASSVRALFNNPGGVLRSGSTGNIVIPRDRQNVIVIPQKATFEVQDHRFVYVVGDSNKVASVPVIVEANSDGQTFVVNSGLTPGQRIVIEGVGTSVKDGLIINPIDAGSQTVPAAQPAAAEPAAVK